MDALWQDTNVYYKVLCFLITENEKLFDRNDSRLYWKTVFHMFSTLHHGYIALFANSIDMEYCTEVEIQTLYTFRIAYLTGWNFLFQTIFLSLSLLYDILEWMGKHEGRIGSKLRYYRDIVFSGLVVPFTLFISCMFWTVYWIDRQLVFPIVYDKIVPWWFNHCVHTNITIVVLVETVLQARRYPADKKIELSLVTFINVAYAIVYYSIYYFANRWLYGVFGIMTWWQVCLYQILIWTSAFIFYFLQFPVNRMFHEDSYAEQNKNEGRNSGLKSDSNLCHNSRSQKCRMKNGLENSKL